MWRIDIIPFHGPVGAEPKLVYYSKLPTKAKLVSLDHFSIMTRISSRPESIAAVARRKTDIAKFLKLRKESRGNVIPFPKIA